MFRMQGLKPEIQYLPLTAELILATSGRGSFIAPAQGFLHYGPSCYLYDHVCNFNYQGAPLSTQLLPTFLTRHCTRSALRAPLGMEHGSRAHCVKASRSQHSDQQLHQKSRQGICTEVKPSQRNFQ
jgi:hypothetical protein